MRRTIRLAPAALLVAAACADGNPTANQPTPDGARGSMGWHRGIPGLTGEPISNGEAGAGAAGVALSLAPATTAVAVQPASPTSIGNCFPFGSNTNFDQKFHGFVYRNVPAFSFAAGDVIAFDLGSLNDVDTRRDIYFAVTNKNPEPYLFGTSRDVRATAWVKVVSEQHVPESPRGNTVVGDYELRFVASAGFTFPGGGLAIGFASAPPAVFVDGGCQQVLVSTNSNDASGQFYGRFYNRAHLDAGPLDTGGGNSDPSWLGGFRVIRTSAPVNTPPVPNAGGPYSGLEGSPVALSGSATDAEGGALTYAWDLNNDGVFETSGATAGRTFADNGTYTVGFRATDAQGASATTTATVSVSNAAPVVKGVKLDPTILNRPSAGQSFPISIVFTDRGTADGPWTITVSWGDGSTDGGAVGSQAEVPASHVYAAPGTYSLRITVRDKDGAVATRVIPVEVQPAPEPAS